jgi:cardiolipin synthase A/B
MKIKRFLGLIVTTIIGVAVFIFFFAPRPTADIKNNAILSLIIEPDDDIAPVLTMIRGASTSVDLAMYELDDKQIEAALAADEARGVAVRVILSAGYKGASSTVNVAAYDFLQEHGVPVRWSPAYFSLTHEKSLVVDGDRALIMTFNLTATYYSTSRDFGIVDSDPRDVGAMEKTFGADWRGGEADARDNGDDLIWSPGSEPALLSIINGAQHTLDIYNEEMDDADVTRALIEAAQRGVAVSVVMTNDGEWNTAFEELATAGVDVRTFSADAALYIHAKVIIADGARAFVGSENFSAGSLYANRELGILLTDPTVISSLTRTFAADQKNATKFTN